MIVVVPVFLPMLTAVAAPPMLRVVAVVLKRLAVAAVVVRAPPLSAIFPTVVIAPEKVERPVPKNEYVGLVAVLPKEIF